MRKVLKWFMTTLMPLLILQCAVWIQNHAYYNTLPLISDWQYWVRILLYGAIAVYLFYLYQSRYAKKELAVLVIPLLYLAFFSLPLSALESNVSVMTFSHRFYSGLTVSAILLFAYLVALGGDEHGNHYYLEIMLPGFVVGGIIGFLTQRWGDLPARKA